MDSKIRQGSKQTFPFSFFLFFCFSVSLSHSATTRCNFLKAHATFTKLIN